jgi:hypothetical protein
MRPKAVMKNLANFSFIDNVRLVSDAARYLIASVVPLPVSTFRFPQARDFHLRRPRRRDTRHGARQAFGFHLSFGSAISRIADSKKHSDPGEKI